MLGPSEVILLEYEHGAVDDGLGEAMQMRAKGLSWTGPLGC